jgi:hypothetical protein
MIGDMAVDLHTSRSRSLEPCLTFIWTVAAAARSEPSLLSDAIMDGRRIRAWEGNTTDIEYFDLDIVHDMY